MAEGIFRRLVQSSGQQDRIFSQSAGLSPVEGAPASENAIAVCKESGIDLSEHRARKLSTDDIDAWDLFFPMTKTHAYILERAGIPPTKIYAACDVPDPYGKDLLAYRSIKEILEKEVRLFYNRDVQRLLLFEP